MSAVPAFEPIAEGRPPRDGRSMTARAEDVALAIVLAAMMALPPLEVALRKTLGRGISNQPSIVQHLTLIAAMMGAAIAAREGRLISLGSISTFIHGRWRSATKLIAGAIAASVGALLFQASAQFVLSERGAAGTVAYGVPLWAVQLALPLGFAIITVRLLLGVSEQWKWRAVAMVCAVAAVLGAMYPPFSPQAAVGPAFGLLLVALLLGAPIFAILGGAGLILFWGNGSPMASLTVDHYGLVTNVTIPTIPLFTLAGYFLAEGGASRRLIRLFKAAVGHVRGGPAILVAIVCAFFTSFTGASGVTILALGGLLMPVLLAAGYTERASLGLLTGAGSLGLLFPPCLPLIFYAVIASVDIRDMFLGGIGPGMLMVVLTALWGISQAPRTVVVGHRYDWPEVWAALWDAKWELFIPVLALTTLFSGLATPVEAAAMTALYAFFVETLVHRDLRPIKDCPRVMAQSGMLVGGVLLIMGVALGLTNYLAFAEIPARAVDWVTGAVHSKWLFLLLLNLFLIGVGMLMDVYSAIIIVVPLIVPLGRAFGIDPIHLGIIFLANLELGYLHPPVGQNLFLSSLRFNKPVSAVFIAVIPMLIIFLFAVVLITYVPAMTTALPQWFRR
jgi:tripartite ATP-independent transporter DctM subunit